MTLTKLLKVYLSNLVLRGNRRKRRIVLGVIDLAVFSLSLYLSIAIRFESFWPLAFFTENSWEIFALIPLQLIIFRASGIYQSILRYSSLTLLKDAVKAVTLSAAVLIALTYFTRQATLSRSVLIINALITLILIVCVRMLFRWIVRTSISHSKQHLQPHRQFQRLLVYGAGGAGAELFQALSHSAQYKIVGFVDDHRDLQRKSSLEGLTIYSPQQISSLRQTDAFDSVVLAMPSVSASVRREIVQRLQQQAIAVKTVPSLTRILSGKVTIQELQDIDTSDLLGREEVSPDLELLRRQIRHNSVLITGAGGSIGSELCRQVARQKPSCLVLFERNEFALYKIHQELSNLKSDIQIIPCLGSVTDGDHMRAVLDQYRVKTVYHAAAYKHVPLLESNIAKGIENNVLGTLTAAQSAIAAGVHQFVLISTDKAVRPTNIMGTTKRVAELTIQALSAQVGSAQVGSAQVGSAQVGSAQMNSQVEFGRDRHSNGNGHSNGNQTARQTTRFAIVRFGNVLDSSGSVVPLFRKQIAQGGPITLTDREITRYFMSIPEAARLVIQAGAMSKGGEVFLLDMGEPVKIYDLATRMITLSGLTPEHDIPIKITGLRPGEKLYEELLIEGDNVRSTSHPKIFCGQESFLPWEELSPKLTLLVEKAKTNNIGLVKALLRILVPEYKPQNRNAKVPVAQAVESAADRKEIDQSSREYLSV